MNKKHYFVFLKGQLNKVSLIIDNNVLLTYFLFKSEDIPSFCFTNISILIFEYRL